MNRFLTAALALGLVLTGCSGGPPPPPSPPALIPASALDGLLLSPDDVNTVMGTTGMTPHARVDVMTDHRNLLPNLNCLGIWQVNEVGVYGTDGWTALRQELLRSPDDDGWQNLAVQSVVLYPSPEAARDFLDQSADRWSKCTDHNVNITLNDQKLPKWRSGELTRTDSALAIPFTRGGTESCQRVLAVQNNVVIDVQACKRPPQPVTQASVIAERIATAVTDRPAD